MAWFLRSQHAIFFYTVFSFKLELAWNSIFHSVDTGIVVPLYCKKSELYSAAAMGQIFAHVIV